MPREASVGPISDRQRSRIRSGQPVERVGDVDDLTPRDTASDPPGVDRRGRRGVAAGSVGAGCVSAAPRAPCRAQPDALPDFSDRRIRRAGKFRPVPGRPSPGFRGARLRWDHAALDPGHGFAGSPPSSRFREHRPRRAASFLVSRRTIRRVRRRRKAQEAGCVGRSATNLVRSAAWECRRGRLLEP
jgi:hypothetical protein